MGLHYDMINDTTATMQIGCVSFYQQMPNDLSVTQRAQWKYRRTNKGRANMMRANSNENGKARDQRYKEAHRILLSQRASSAQKENGNKNQKKYRAEHSEEIKLKNNNRAKLKILTLTALEKEELKIKNRERQKNYIRTPRGKLLRDKQLMSSSDPKWQLFTWSANVRRRDNFQCVNCDSLIQVEAHHVKPKAQYPELMLDEENGISLCKDCHRAGHELIALVVS